MFAQEQVHGEGGLGPIVYQIDLQLQWITEVDDMESGCWTRPHPMPQSSRIA